MWLTIGIAAAAFTVMVLMLALGYQQIEEQRSERSAAVLAGAPAVQPGRCMLCNAPLRQPTTPDQVVFEVEHRIDTELQAVLALLGRGGRATTPETFARLYQA